MLELPLDKGFRSSSAQCTGKTDRQPAECRMKGFDRNLLANLGILLFQACLHLLSSPVGKGDGEQATRLNSGLNCVQQTFCEDGGFSGADRGQYQDCAVDVIDDGLLVLVGDKCGLRHFRLESSLGGRAVVCLGKCATA